MSNHEKQFVTKVGAVYRTCVFASDYEELQVELAKARELLKDARHFCQRAPSVLPHIDAWLERNQ